MKVKAVFLVLTIIMISISVLTLTPRAVQASPETILYLDPPSIANPTLIPEDTFAVDIMISEVEYLYSWQINMSFNPAVLRIADIIEGNFLKNQPEGTFSVERIENEEGWALFGEVTKGAYIGVSGSGTLASVEFQVHGIGESLIKIETDHLTYLLQQLSIYPPPEFNALYPPQDFTAQNSYFNNFGADSPQNLILRLIGKIEPWSLPKGTENSLISKLEGTLHLLDIGNENGATHKLMEFLSQVEVLRLKKLTNEQADYLMAESQKIIDLINE